MIEHIAGNYLQNQEEEGKGLKKDLHNTKKVVLEGTEIGKLV